MERLLEILVKGAEPGLTARTVCGCRECETARAAHDAKGPCRVQVRRLAAFLSQRLRTESPRGAGVMGRLLEDTRRYARLMASSQAAGLRAEDARHGWAAERPLHLFPIESES